MSNIANPKHDCVRVKRTARIAQLFGILARPDQAIQAAIDRSLDTDIEHVLVYVCDSYLRAALSHAKCDVTSAARHIENGLTWLRFHALHKAIFPKPVHSARHGIIHDVVLFGDA